MCMMWDTHFFMHTPHPLITTKIPSPLFSAACFTLPFDLALAPPLPFPFHYLFNFKPHSDQSKERGKWLMINDLCCFMCCSRFSWYYIVYYAASCVIFWFVPCLVSAPIRTRRCCRRPNRCCRIVRPKLTSSACKSAKLCRPLSTMKTHRVSLIYLMNEYDVPLKCGPSYAKKKKNTRGRDVW